MKEATVALGHLGRIARTAGVCSEGGPKVWTDDTEPSVFSFDKGLSHSTSKKDER